MGDVITEKEEVVATSSAPIAAAIETESQSTYQPPGTCTAGLRVSLHIGCSVIDEIAYGVLQV